MVLKTDASNSDSMQRSRDLLYMKYFRIALILVGAWPGKAFGENDRFRRPFQCWNIFVCFHNIIGGLIYIKNNYGKLSFFDMGQTYITVLITWVAFTRFSTILFCSKKNDELLVQFVDDFHIFNHKNESAYAMKTHLYIHKLSHFFTLYVLMIGSTAAVLFNVSPLLNNISNGAFSSPIPPNITYEHSVYYALPFDYLHNHRGFLVIFIFNWYASFLCASIVAIYDLMISLLVFHLWGHLKILIYKLEYFPRPGFIENASNNASDTHYSREEVSEVFEKLKSIIIHHTTILRCIKDFSDSAGFNLANYYIFHQICGCLLLLESAQMDTKALIRFAFLTFGLTALMVQTSIVFELLSAKAEPLMRAAYNIPWECMDTKNRKLVLILLCRTQRPLGLKAMGMVQVGVRTMAMILKSTVSYYMMLRTFASNE